MVLIVQERFGLGPWALAVFLAGGAAGGVLAGFTSQHVLSRIRRGRAMQLSMIGFMAFPVGILLARQHGPAGLAVATLTFFVSEFFGVLWNTVSVSYRQRSIPRALLGRVNAAYRLFALGMVPLGMAAGGALTRVAGAHFGRDTALDAPFWMALVISAVVTAAFWRFIGRAIR